MRNRDEGNCGLRIADCGLKTRKVRQADNPKSEIRNPKSRRRSRRGVLLLVVLSMLVLFMLVGTAFLMTSNQTRTTMKEMARQDRLGNLATRLLDRAALQVLRDTESPNSVLRYLSLLRDLYGTDGFQGVIYAFRSGDPVDLGTPTNGSASTRFSGATAAFPSGPTNGQFIDIFFKKLGASIDDPDTAENEGVTNNIPDLRNVLKLDRDPFGKPQLHTLSLIKGYYNGCLLTITSGVAAGQSTRILDYEYLGSKTTKGTTAYQLFRFRVMAFPTKDGQPLQPNSSRLPELTELSGASFIVNGRAFSGTGVGYNPLAVTGAPRLSALELFDTATGVTATTTTKTAIGGELALLPNSVYFNPLRTAVGSMPSDKLGNDPFLSPPLAIAPVNTYTPGAYWPLNFIPTAGTPTFLYPSFVGCGGANEGYDAADFQNMLLALQTVTPRGEGRVVTDKGTWSVSDYIADPTSKGKFLRLDLEDLPMPSLHRPDLINFWYHRLFTYLTSPPISIPAPQAARAIIQPYSNISAVDPLGTPTPPLSPQQAALIASIKRHISLRPVREDHPDFDGGNSVAASNSTTIAGLKDTSLVTADSKEIAVPISEIVGPWDVDNDNDGVRDSVWVDLGDPIMETEDGRRYKTLYSILCVDLDSRLNVNAHGMADDLVPPAGDATKSTFFDPTYAPAKPANWTGTNLSPPPQIGNLAHPWPDNPNGLIGSTLQLPRGLGYGPAEISLRPVFQVPVGVPPSFNPIYNKNRVETTLTTNPVDSYATLLLGRQTLDGKSINGRYGFDTNQVPTSYLTAATAGANYAFSRNNNYVTGEQATPSVAAQMKFFEYPWSFWNAPTLLTPNPQRTYSGFGTAPDLKGRYALGLDYAGQPVYEAAADTNPQTALSGNKLPFNLLAKSPYELDLSSSQRRDSWSSELKDPATGQPFKQSSDGFKQSLIQNDDASYSPTDLEKVLRAWDADSGTLPSRLWDVVSEFDPVKLGTYNPNYVLQVANSAFGFIPKTTDPEFLAAAQQITGINRRLVTTDSYDLSVANQTMPSYVSDFGPDGAKGRRNDAAHGTFNYGLNAVQVSDDFQVITGVERARAKITDLLYYRAWLEARRYVMRVQGLTEGGLDSLSWTDYQKFMVLVKQRTDLAFPLMGDLLAPEVLAGRRMDLNRPFGNGKDDNADGVVDDPLEAGEPFLDVNGNGKRDDGTNGTPVEPFLDLNGNGRYDLPGDQLWPELAPVVSGGNGTLAERIEFDYTNGHAEPIHAFAQKALNLTILGGVRNLESQGRQLFARHLYCLMLLLTDENYIAPWDENDAQVMTYMDVERKKLIAASPALSPAEADLVVKRKLTCRMIAQWAVNCVDMRDSDAIMTPFEYDENPWDGWGVWDDKWKDPSNFAKATFIPIDGDPATDENNAWVIDWTKAVGPSGGPKVIVQLGVDPAQAVSTTNPPLITYPLDQTRGLVWGAERPELLITETLALHDRRTEDLTPSSGGHDTLVRQHSSDPSYYLDEDLDQGLRPHGTLMVELFNPWSPLGQLPAELYTQLDSRSGYQPKIRTNSAGVAQQGVELGRLSNLAWDDDKGCLSLAATDASKGIKRSPVWRMIVVQEWWNARNTEKPPLERSDLLLSTNPNAKEPTAYANYQSTKLIPWATTMQGPPPFRPTDPDFSPTFGADMLQFTDPATGRTTSKLVGPDFMTTTGVSTPTEKQFGDANKFYVTYPSIEREFYFTTDKSPLDPKTWNSDLNQPKQANIEPDWDYSAKKFKLRIPDRSIHIGGIDSKVRVQTQKFIPFQLEWETVPAAQQPQAVIAPVLPGRYAVIGSAGTNYSHVDTNQYDPNRQTYTTAIGRNQANSDGTQTPDSQHDPKQTRRIELRPSFDPDAGAPGNPHPHQLVVACNGGDPKDEGPALAADETGKGIRTFDPYSKEIVRDNELINDMTDTTTPPNPQKDPPPGDPPIKGTVKNIFDSQSSGDAPTGKPNSRYYNPCVVIPIEGMNVSEPPWGYGPREKEAADQEASMPNNTTKTAPPTPAIFIKNSNNKWEGRYYGSVDAGAPDRPYDKPFDTAPELMRTGTTANYRMVHLQRLANPMLPWNPYQFLADGQTQNPDWKPNLPINPYLTVDSSSVNLTAYCGTSLNEIDLKNDKKIAEAKFRPWVTGVHIDEEQKGYLDGLKAGNQIWYFRSLERGFWSRLNYGASNPPANGATTYVPQRILWAQEPAMIKLTKPTAGGLWPNLLDLIDGRQMTMAAREVPSPVVTSQGIKKEQGTANYCNMVLKHSLGYGNESFGLLYDQVTKGGLRGAKQGGTPPGSSTSSAIPNGLAASAIAGVPAPSRILFTHEVNSDGTLKGNPQTFASTNPWLAWDNRPYVSADELLKVPAGSQAQMLRMYSAVDPNVGNASKWNGYGLAELGAKQNPTSLPNVTRYAAMQAPFGHLLNAFAATVDITPTGFVPGVANVVRDSDLPPATRPAVVQGVPVRFDKTGVPVLPDDPMKPGDILPYGAPNFGRILDYVQVPSRFVGTDTMLNAETFNDVPGVNDSVKAVGSDITGPTDPRINFQPPFNKVSRERDPGRVNLNTVLGRRTVESGVPHIWSEVFDGIMHRNRDSNLSTGQTGHFGPAWRDVVLSRRGYAQIDAAANLIDKPFDKAATDPTAKPLPNAPPDTLQFGLNNSFPTFFANPFRSSDAGDLVPLAQMVQTGADASFQRVHPRNRGMVKDSTGNSLYDPIWGGTWPAGFTAFNDARDAGFGNDGIAVGANGAIPYAIVSQDPTVTGQRDTLPLFSESRSQSFADTDRNPYMMYEPMSRLGNLVTNRSGCYAVWITVGYFEVEPAPAVDTTRADWGNQQVKDHFGGDISLYNRAYPDGYMLGKELGSETGDVKRPRGFYIIDRTEEVGFKPGEDLNVEKTIRLRRRIE